MREALVQIIALSRSLAVEYPRQAKRLRDAIGVSRGMRDMLLSDRRRDGLSTTDPFGWMLTIPKYRDTLDAVKINQTICDQTWGEVGLLRELVAGHMPEVFPEFAILAGRARISVCIKRAAWHDDCELDWNPIVKELQALEVAARRRRAAEE